MRFFPHSYNDFLFQQDNKISSEFQTSYDWSIGGLGTVKIPRSQNFPVRVSKTYDSRVKVIDISLLPKALDMTRDDLVIAMSVLGSEQGRLVALDELGRAWYVLADFIELTEDSTDGKTASFGAIFDVDDPIWRKLEPSRLTIPVDETGSGTIRPIGNQPALPIITITPTSSGDFGFTYKRFVQVTNNSDNALVNYPLNLTGSGLDTADLIGDGKMLSDGKDLRVYVDGVEVKRWFGGGGINSTTTKIWINWNQPANSNMTLGGAIASSGDIALIQIANTAQNAARMALIPSHGNVLIGTEIFVYTGKNVANLQLTGITRGERQTSEAAHSVSDAIKFLTHDVWVYYGYPTIAPYVVDDSRKPIIKLTSTNTSHIYEEFFDTAGLRTAIWAQMKLAQSKTSRFYTATQNTLANPATVAGVWVENNSILAWKLYNPCYITHITMTGKKYSQSTFYNCSLVASLTGNYDASQVLIWFENTPSSLSTWVALDSHSNVSLGGSYTYLLFAGSFIKSFNPQSLLPAAVEASDVTITLDSTKTPTVTLAAESSNNTLNSSIANGATGETLDLLIALAINNPLIINCREKTIALADGTNAIAAIQDMPIRAEWFRFLPLKDNLITITDPGQATYAFEWEDRAL